MIKRWCLGIVSVIAIVVIGAVPVGASVDDFTITSYMADYYLDRDSEGRSTLRTEERITAQFPAVNQNHGIERAIPKSYDGHPTSLTITDVTDGEGQKVPYGTYESNGNEVLRIGDPDVYVHGQRTYSITYEQRDVSRYFANTDRDEFYWDTNGTEWRVPIQALRVTVHVSERLLPALTPDIGCFKGVMGAVAGCEIRREGNDFTVSTGSMGAGENVTIAFGFNAGTFRGYEPSASEKFFGVLFTAWAISLVAGSAIGVILIFVFSFRYYAKSNRKRHMGTIVTEYLPPKDMSVAVAAQIAPATVGHFSAQIIDLAVRRYVKVYQTKEKTLWHAAEYELEIEKPITGLRQEERRFIATIFGDKGTVLGARLAMNSLKSNYAVASKLQKDTKALAKEIRTTYGLRAKNEHESRWFGRIGIWVLIVGCMTVSPLLIVAGVIGLVCARQLYPLTEQGLALRRYLMGLREYIVVAEARRLEMLQSPEGAEKIGKGVANTPGKLVKLYEKVLPYAILFGQEKEWNKHLGEYYSQSGSQPEWYTGQASFNAALFAGSMNDFSATVNNYSAATSSSSGGSTGGGSSGGGGGGGGGGGW